MGCPCETRTSTCRSFATISSGLYRFLAITVLLDVKDIPQVGPLQWGRITIAMRDLMAAYSFDGLVGQSAFADKVIGRKINRAKSVFGQRYRVSTAKHLLPPTETRQFF